VTVEPHTGKKNLNKREKLLNNGIIDFTFRFI